MTGQVPAFVEREHFDLIVIGAGINGAGIARDAALRGLRVLLLDKGFPGGGTTSWATRLIHGGLRYLEHYEVALVRESLREREILLRIAPHLVRPLPFVVPVYSYSKRGMSLIRLGMAGYDVLSFEKSVPRHRMLSREQLLAQTPGLATAGLQGGAMYWDAQVTFPERLTLENVLSAREQGAVVLPHSRVVRLLQSGGRVSGVEFIDLTSGTTRRALGATTINAAGPWVDELLDSGLRPGGRPMIGGTKGSHIVVRAFPGAPRQALYVEARSNGRPYFIVPWNNLYLIGTTDFRYTGDLDRVVPDEAEIAYLIEETNAVLPAAGLTRENVLYAYAGVRPLPFQTEGSEGAITRRHIVHDHAPDVEGLITIVGGKLTTYRNLAQQAVDLVYRKNRRRPPRSVTARVPLPGARALDFGAFSEDFLRSDRVPPESSAELLRVYGTRAAQVIDLAAGRPDLLTPFSAGGAVGAQVLFALERELAVTLTDVMMHTTMVGWEPDTGVGPDARAADIAGNHAGWSGERRRSEINSYRSYIERYRPRALASI